MATKSPALTDPELQSRMEEAYQKLVSSLDERKNRFFDPTWLAAAQAFATPTKTGSGFEALGNVLGAVGKSQEEEARKDFELNKAKFDINKELLALNQQRKRQEFGMGELNEPQPTPPPAAGFTPEQPPAGALPGQPPAGAGALTSAVAPQPTMGGPVAPPTAEAVGNLPSPVKPPSAAQTEFVPSSAALPPTASYTAPSPAGALPAAAPSAVPPPDDLRWGMTPAGRKIARAAFGEGASFADSVKKGQEHDAAIQKRLDDAEKLRIERARLGISEREFGLKTDELGIKKEELGLKRENVAISREELKVKQDTLKNEERRTDQNKYVKIGNAIVDIDTKQPVFIEGGNEVIIGGKTYSTDPATATRFNNARLNGNSAEVRRLGQEIMNIKPGAAKVLSKEEKVIDEKQKTADIEAEKELKIQKRKEEEKRQTELVSKIPALKEQKNDTKTLIEIFNKKDVQKVLGPTANPGVKAAIGEVVSGGLNVGGYQVAITNFDKAIVQVDAPKEVIDQLNVAGSLLRKAELLNAKTYLKGEGTVTNMERAIVQDINGLVYKDPPNALLFKSQLAYAQANMNERYIRTFQDWRDKNPEGTIEQFNRSKAYDTIENDYSDDLKRIKKSIGVGPAPTETSRNESTLTTVRNKLQGYANRATP